MESQAGRSITPSMGRLRSRNRQGVSSARLGSTTVCMFGIAALATLLRMMLSGEKGFGPDEIRSVFYARLDWAPFFRLALPLEANMSLYFFLLRFWRLAGESEVVIRSLSVAAGAATVPALYLLGRRLFSPRVG